MKKINSEIKVDQPLLKINWGTIDKKNPSSIYLEVGTYITPIEYVSDYTSSVKSMDRDVKSIVREKINDMPSVSNDFIFVSDIADTRITFGKKSYLSYQVHMMRSNADKKPFKTVAGEFDKQWTTTYSEILSSIQGNGFTCSKTKN